MGGEPPAATAADSESAEATLGVAGEAAGEAAERAAAAMAEAAREADERGAAEEGALEERGGTAVRSRR